MTRKMSPQEQAAHRYADAGWPVFPCGPGSKAPATTNGFKDATTNHGRIDRWWNGWGTPRNVAIATGAPGPDVLDVDRHGPRKEDTGYPALSRLIREGLVTNPNATVRTPSGGAHLYFAGTGQGNGHMAKQHIDFRSQGGYVVAPPSNILDQPYEVIGQTQMSGRAVNWQKVKDFLEPPRPQVWAPPKPGSEHSSADRIIGFVGRQQLGNCNNSLYWATHELIRLGQWTPDNEARLSEASIRSGVPARDVERTIRSAVTKAAASFQGQREAAK